MMWLEIIFYAVNEHIGAVEWSAVDMGGSMYVHTFGAFFGLGVSFMLARKQSYANRLFPVPTSEPAKDQSNEMELFGSTKTSDMFAMIGTLFLWMFWPSFNGALAVGNQQHRVVINTVLSLTNSCVGAFIFSRLLRPGHKLDMVDIQNATLAGGVAVGSSADLVIDPWSALMIGFLAGAVSVCGYVYISPMLERKLGLHDTCGVLNLHGIPGIMGGLGGAISAATASESVYGDKLHDIFSAMKDDDRTAAGQGAYQAAALALTLAISISSGCFTGAILGQMKAPPTFAEDKPAWHIEEDEMDHVA
ncbi:unnamed protein product [Amoebophrya sp. A25]|nr:unnamed protein product [Amoebophrya sp. A25]|eukprot:GSA25T00010101001.1